MTINKTESCSFPSWPLTTQIIIDGIHVDGLLGKYIIGGRGGPSKIIHHGL